MLRDRARPLATGLTSLVRVPRRPEPDTEQPRADSGPRRSKRPAPAFDHPCRVHGCNERAHHLIEGGSGQPLPIVQTLPPGSVPLCTRHLLKLRAWEERERAERAAQG